MANVPYISIQPTYATAFADVSQVLLPQETPWLSIYAQNAPHASIHGKLLLEPCVEQGASSSANAQERKDTAGGVKVSVASGSFGTERIAGSYTDLLVRTPPVSAGSLSSSSAAPSQLRSARKRVNRIEAGPTLIRFPKKNIQTPLKTRIGVTAFDVSASGNGLFAAGGEDGKLFVARTTQGDAIDERSGESGSNDADEDEESRIERIAQERIRRRQAERERDSVLKLTGHVGDIRSLRFFPSGEVILSTSSDLTARVFSAKANSNPRTLKGHKRAILCSEIVERGRNVLTAGADGTVRLWDVGSEKQITSLASERFSSVQAMALDRSIRRVGGLGESQSESESADSQDPFTGRVLATALGSGQIELHDLATRTPAALISSLATFPPGPAPAASDLWEQHPVGGLLSLDWAPDRHLLVAGSAYGVVALHDDRMLGKGSAAQGDAQAMETDAAGGAATTSTNGAAPSLLGTWRRNNAAINDLRLVANASGKLDVIVATADGLPYRASLDAFLANPSTASSPASAAAWSTLQGQDENFALAPGIVEEYAEWDCDNVERIAVDAAGRVWLAGTDGRIRGY